MARLRSPRSRWLLEICKSLRVPVRAVIPQSPPTSLHFTPQYPYFPLYSAIPPTLHNTPTYPYKNPTDNYANGVL